MEKDEKHYDFAYEVAIGNVLWNIERKEELSKDGKFRVDCIKEYFQEVNKSLNSIIEVQLDPESGKGYIFTPHLFEVLEVLADKPKKQINLDDIVKCREEFNSINSKLDNLKTNPREFYDSADSKYIFSFMKKIKPFFETPHVPFMTCCGEDIGGDD